MSKFRTLINKATFTLKKHSPEILAAAGVIGTVTAAVMACRATTRLDDILSEANQKLDNIKAMSGKEVLGTPYSEETAKKDTVITYAHTAGRVVRLYAPAVLLGALSISSILASNDILRKRNMALAAAYATVDEGFKSYRKRVAERLGEEAEKEIKYNLRQTDIEETETDENGNERTVTRTVNAVDISENSEYARFFDESSPYYEKDSEYNLMFLKSQQAYANDRLKANGILFLNEVYDMLGIPKTRAGQIVGWVYDEENPIGDNFVDFGIYDCYSEAKRDFVNGYERAILLDFNVDGNIWNYM
ncbi:MAG: DUF6353 family protein [Ruminococcus sp.]|nr:DUF6353 family protein [Ruminococcus sp.]